MFQSYTHAGSVDSRLPYVDSFVPSADPLFQYGSPWESGMSFASLVEDEAFFPVVLSGAPKDALLSVNLGLQGKPAGLSSAAVLFFDSADVRLGFFPVHGNGLGQHADAVPIPPGAVKAHVYVWGMAGKVLGHIRVVAREAIPFQPLKG